MPQPSLPLSSVMKWAENRECTDAVLLVRTPSGELKWATTSHEQGVSEKMLTDALEAMGRRRKACDPERP